LVGVDNGHHMNHSPFKGNQVETSYGLALAIVESDKDAGTIQVNVSADGVQHGQVTITTLPSGDARLLEAVTTREKLFRENNKKSSRHLLAKIKQFGNLVAGANATASSSSSEHPPSHAIDGKPETRWCPKDGNTGHSWQVDLGGPRDLKSAKIIWQTASKYHYTVEGSVDGTNWVMLSDQSKKQDAQQEHNLAFDSKGIRHVKITTTGLPNGLWGTFQEVEIQGVTVDGPQTIPAADASMTGTGALIVAPVFKHGSGQHADSVVASRNKKPPTWSENEARNIVRDEARKLGIEFTVEGEMPLGMDGVTKTGKIAFEILTSDDVPDRIDNTDRITDFHGAAGQLVKDLKTKSGEYIVGIFYDPLMGKGTAPDEEPLRQQVRDFGAWLKKEKYLN